jgi:hypothetical protein
MSGQPMISSETVLKMIKKQLLFWLLLLAVNLSAQDSTRLQFSNKIFEIGIDGATALHNTQGIGFVAKARMGQPVFKKWGKQSALRLVTTFYKNDQMYNYRYELSADSFRINNDTSYSRYTNIAFGIERQLVKKRMRYNYGMDIVYEFGQSEGSSQTLTEKGGQVYPVYASMSTTDNRKVGISIFVGCNFYILRWLSIGTEIHMPLLIEKSVRVANTTNGYLYSEDYLLRSGAGIPRLFYLGVHF